MQVRHEQAPPLRTPGRLYPPTPPDTHTHTHTRAAGTSAEPAPVPSNILPYSLLVFARKH